MRKQAAPTRHRRCMSRSSRWTPITELLARSWSSGRGSFPHSVVPHTVRVRRTPCAVCCIPISE
jgi:hypothetical protein